MMFVTFGSRIVNSHFFNCFWFQQWHTLLDPQYGGIDYAYRIHSNHLVQKTLDIVQSDQRRWTESHNTAANSVQQLPVQHVQEYYVEWRGTHSNLYCIHLHANDERARSLGMQSIGWFIFCALHFNQFFFVRCFRCCFGSGGMRGAGRIRRWDILDTINVFTVYESMGNGELEWAKCRNVPHDRMFVVCFSVLQAITQSMILAICTNFLFVRIHFMFKLAIGVCMVGGYSCIIFFKFDFIYSMSPSINASLNAKVAHLLIVIFIAIIFHMIDRQAEYIARVDYKWVNMSRKHERVSSW